METLNLILDLAYEIGMNVISNFFIYGFISGIIGLVLGIWIVRKINKNKGFDRGFGLWTFVAKLNMLYLPLVAMISMGVIGGIYGLNDSINSYVETSVNFSIDQIMPYLTEDTMTSTVTKYGSSWMVTDAIDTLFWVAYRGAFIFFFITLMKWPIIEFIIHKIFSSIFSNSNSKVNYS